MPTYLYGCAKCGAREERREGLTAAMSQPCPTPLCKGIFQRESVYAVAHTRGLPADHKPPDEFYRLHREAQAAKQEAKAEKHEAVMNGFAPRSNQ